MRDRLDELVGEMERLIARYKAGTSNMPKRNALWFSDGVHLSGDGVEAYKNFVRQGLSWRQISREMDIGRSAAKARFRQFRELAPQPESD